MPVPRAAQKTSGLHSIAESIEKDFVGDIYVITDKEKKGFPYSLFSITDLKEKTGMSLNSFKPTPQPSTLTATVVITLTKPKAYPPDL